MRDILHFLWVLGEIILSIVTGRFGDVKTLSWWLSQHVTGQTKVVGRIVNGWQELFSVVLGLAFMVVTTVLLAFIIRLPNM